MNILELKRRLLPYGGFRNDAADDGSDAGGEVLNITAGDDDDDGPGDADDRGDDFTPTGDADAGAEDGDDGQVDDGKPGRAIPYARFRESNARRRAAEEQLAETQRELEALRASGGQPGRAPSPAPAVPAAPAAPAFDLDAAEDEYTQAMLDGDGAKARAVRRQINQAIEDNAVARFESSMSERQSAALVEDVAGQVLTAYPWLNEPGGEAAMDAIVALRESKEAAGMPRHEALAFAVNLLAPRFAPTETPSRALPEDNTPRDTRLAKAHQRNAAHSLMQPPAAQAGIGNRSEAAQLDPEKLTEAEFDALPEAEKKRMRGD